MIYNNHKLKVNYRNPMGGFDGGVPTCYHRNEPLFIPLIVKLSVTVFTWMCIKTIKWGIVGVWALKKAFLWLNEPTKNKKFNLTPPPKSLGVTSFKAYLNHKTTDTGPR